MDFPLIKELTEQQLSVLRLLPAYYLNGDPAAVDQIADAASLSVRATFNVIDDLVSMGLTVVEEEESDKNEMSGARWRNPHVAKRTLGGDFNVGAVIAVVQRDNAWAVEIPPTIDQGPWTVELWQTKAEALRRAKAIGSERFYKITVIASEWAKRAKPVYVVPARVETNKKKKTRFGYYVKRDKYDPRSRRLVPSPDHRYNLSPSLAVMNDETNGLLGDQRVALKKIDELFEVDESYKNTLRFLVYRMIANPLARIFCYQIAQLSELGTGIGSSWENGGVQSDHRDDVVINLIDRVGGQTLNLRLQRDILIVWGNSRGTRRSKDHYVRFPNLTWENREQLAGKIDRIMERWYFGADY